MRKDVLANGEVYHIFTKSIADYIVFNNDHDFERMRQLITYYNVNNNIKFSDFISSVAVQKEGFDNFIERISKDKDETVQIIAYCFMPTHVHLILKQLSEDGIVNYMRKILNSYSSYFNTLHKRRGPLWESRFKNVLVKDDEQLLHLTRYLHLNPVTAFLVKKPEEWSFSSYGEYLYKENAGKKLCRFNDLLEINHLQYRKFTNDQISYQRELGKIKKLLLD